MKAIQRCPVCGSRPLITVKQKINRDTDNKFLQAALDEYYLKLCNESVPMEMLSMCSRCFSIYRARFFDDRELAQIYGHLYKRTEERFSREEGYVYNKTAFLEGCSSKMFDTVRNMEEQFGTKFRTIFDIGGRDGFRLRKLSEHGYVCKVFDPISCDACNSRIVKENKWANEIPKNEKADLIILCEVVEHCTDPCAIMRDCYDHLDDGGVVFLELPPDIRDALRWMFKERFFGRDLAIDATHNVFYSLRGVSRLFEDAGLNMVLTRYGLLPAYNIRVIEAIARRSSDQKRARQ